MRGVRLGIDIGSVRIGVAVSDPDGLLASPMVTVRRDHRGADLAQLARLVTESGAVEVIVGLPLSLSGTKGRAALAAERYAGRLAKRIAPVPVRFTDERLTTVVATRALREQGVRGAKQRAVVDQVAAAEILQGWLDSARRQGLFGLTEDTRPVADPRRGELPPGERAPDTSAEAAS